MNDNARQLIEDMENGRLEQFCMKVWNSCGTPSCIGGHIEARMGRHYSGAPYGSLGDPMERIQAAALFVGIDTDIAESLFYADTRKGWPWDWWRDPDSVYDFATMQDGARALRRAIELTEARSAKAVNAVQEQEPVEVA